MINSQNQSTNHIEFPGAQLTPFEIYLQQKFTRVQSSSSTYSRQTQKPRKTPKAASMSITKSHSRLTVMPEPQMVAFDNKNEKQLRQLRKIFSVQNSVHKQYMNEKQQIFDNFVDRVPKERATNAVEVVKQQKHTTNKHQFPQWLRDRQDFNQLRKSKYFNLEHKVISICEMDSFKREEDQKKLVALYLQKQSFFRIMPFQMLMDIAARLRAQHFQVGDIVCHKGDMGEEMFIVYKGSVDVLVRDDKVLNFKDNAILGRNALDKNVPRSATIKVVEPTALLMLHRYDYQKILNNVMTIERSKWVYFIKSLKLFQHFEEAKIQRLCQELNGKFISEYDTLYRSGEPTDNIYLVKNGRLVKRVVVDLEEANRWPVSPNTWMKKTYSKTIEVEIIFGPESILGYADVVNDQQYRNETIEPLEDCFVLWISKGLFLDIFDQSDLTCFQDYLRDSTPQTFKDFVKNIQKERKIHRNKINLIQTAISSNLSGEPAQRSEQISNKLNHLVQRATSNYIKHKNQYRLIKSDSTQKIVKSQYES